MKKPLLTITISILLTLNMNGFVSAQTTSPSQSQAKEEETIVEKQINQLKEKIASRVAQLNLVEKRGIMGTVSDVSDTVITLKDANNDTRLVDVDELTKFSSPSAKDTFGISDIEPGTKLGVLGLYNKQTKRLLARFITAISTPKTYHGAVSSIDSDNFSVNIITSDKKEHTVDIEKTTTTLSYTDDTDLTKSGFSKIEDGQRILVVGYDDEENKNNIIADRIIIFPTLPSNPKIDLPEQTISENLSPSPIQKSSPTPSQ